MPEPIPLEVQPNQSLTIRLDDARYKITLKALNEDLMAITIERNDKILVQNIRAMPSLLLLPTHLQHIYGNFIFKTTDEEYPYYTKFGDTHILYYLPYAETL